VRRLVVTLAALAVLALQAGAPAEAKSYRNCKALNQDYAHGVGKWGAHDHTSGTPVTNFKRSRTLYRQNKNLDRDGDRIACETR
jgi:hypothetical protein